MWFCNLSNFSQQSICFFAIQNAFLVNCFCTVNTFSMCVTLHMLLVFFNICQSAFSVCLSVCFSVPNVTCNCAVFFCKCIGYFLTDYNCKPSQNWLKYPNNSVKIKGEMTRIYRQTKSMQLHWCSSIHIPDNAAIFTSDNGCSLPWMFPFFTCQWIRL